MARAVVECEHAFLSEQNLETLSRQLQSRSARWRQPFIHSEPLRSRKTQIAYLLLLDPAVEFDDERISMAEVELLLRRHGFKTLVRPEVRS